MPLVFDVEYHIPENLINIHITEKSPFFIKRTTSRKFVLLLLWTSIKKVHTSGNRAYISCNNGWPSASSSVCVHRSEDVFTKSLWKSSSSSSPYGVISSISEKDKFNAIERHIHVVLCIAVLSVLRKNVFLVRALNYEVNRNSAFPLKYLLTFIVLK